MLLVSRRAEIVALAQILIAAFSLIWSAAGICAQDARTLRFDFGGTSGPKSSGWNIAHRARVAGVLVADAKDAEGVVTAVSLEQVDAWSGFNTDGATRGTPFPSSATSDSFYLGDNGDRTAALIVRGLMPGRSYAIRFFASRMRSKAVGRKALYRVGAKEAALAADNNLRSVARINDCIASAQGVLRIDILVAPQSQFAYLGVMELTGAVSTLEQVRGPLRGPSSAPATTAAAWAIGDGASGALLAGKRPRGAREMASTTKLMTALLVAEIAQSAPDALAEQVTVSAKADATGGSTARLRKGDRLSVHDTLRGLLLPSGNDAAVVLAEHFGLRFPGDPADSAQVRFVAAMNRRASELRLGETLYFDPHGNSRNRSCAADLLLLAAQVMKHDSLQRIVNTRRYVASVMGKNGRPRRVEWKNTNQMLRHEGVFGVKTGTTRGAGACLVTSVRVDGRAYLLVVLGATTGPGRYVDTKNLIQWARRERLGAGPAPGK